MTVHVVHASARLPFCRGAYAHTHSHTHTRACTHARTVRMRLHARTHTHTRSMWYSEVHVERYTAPLPATATPTPDALHTCRPSSPPPPLHVFVSGSSCATTRLPFCACVDPGSSCATTCVPVSWPTSTSLRTSSSPCAMASTTGRQRCPLR